MKTPIESIRDYFDTCPILDEKARLHLDYLGLEPIEYAIYTEPTDPVIKKYVDGGELRQHTFIFAIRNPMSSAYVTQLENIAFFDRLIQWIEQNSREKILPKLEGNNRESQRLEILSNGYLMATENGQAQYQIQMRLVYKEEHY